MQGQELNVKIGNSELLFSVLQHCGLFFLVKEAIFNTKEEEIFKSHCWQFLLQYGRYVFNSE